MGWVLGGIFLVAFVGCAILGWMFFQERQTARQEQKQAIRHFSAAVRRRLTKGIDGFDLTAFAKEAGMSAADARVVGDDIYASMARKALADGRVTAKERATLDKLALALHVPPLVTEQIEEQAAQGVFKQVAGQALADGALTSDEACELDELRSRLGLSKSDAFGLVSGSVEDSYVAQFRSMLYRGRISQADTDELLRMRETFGLSEERAFELVRNDAENAYREYFTTLKQDGEISDAEEKSLDTLARFLGLPSNSTVQVKEDIKWLRHLTDCRNGRLPHAATRKMLEGGEICHFESRCRFRWQSPSKQQEVDGELTITDKRVIFTSAVRSHEFRPSKIADIDLYGDGLLVTLTSGRGTGAYFIDRADEAEAILTAIAKKHKYIAVEGFSSETTRHIPRVVRQEVWARDGGKCTECNATDYLEFDHIIPHSRGGANTVNNVQLLCRRCNGIKSDRI